MSSKRQSKFRTSISVFSIAILIAVGMSAAPSQAANPASVNLGNAASFAVLAKTYITTGASSTINGDIGAGAAITTGATSTHRGSIYAGAAITTGAGNTIDGNLFAGAAITNGAGTEISGSQKTGQPAVSPSFSSAMTSLDSAFSDATNRTATVIDSELGGKTLTSGVYSATSAAYITLTGVLTLDAANDPNAVFIIRSTGYLVAAASSSVALINGAQAKNVFWVTGGYMSIGANAKLAGNIMSADYVTLGANAEVQGRIFSRAGYVLFGTSGPQYSFGLSGIGTTTSTSAVIAAFSPTFSSSTPTSVGFTFSITNYDGSYTWSGTATNGGIVTINSSGLVTVTGVLPNTSSTATIIATKTGAPTGSKTLSGTSLASGLFAELTPTFSSSTPTSVGFTFSITNYDGSYTWSGTATNGGIVTINSSGLVTVSGVLPNTSSIATIIATKTGAPTGSKTLSGTSLASGLFAELTPTFSSSTPTSDGFTFSTPNYDGSYTWSGTATNGGIVTINGSGLVTVTGVLPNTSSTATIIATKTGAPTGSKTLSGTSLTAGSGTHFPTSDGFTFNIPNYDGSYTWSGTATNGGIVTINSSGLVRVTGLARGTSSTVTITSTRTGFPTASQTLSGASTALAQQKITVGSFKGYVALYAMGYEGQRLSAKIGNDWVIVPVIPASLNDVYRWVEPVGFGVDCVVRIFIDRVLVKTVNLTTK